MVIENSCPKILEINGINKSYAKNKPVNEDIYLSVHEGEVFGLLGPNGAGKTTLINQIIGLVRPDSGTITIDGIDIVSNPKFTRQACSFQAQTQVPIAGLTAIQAIELVGMIRGGKNKDVKKRTRELLEALEIEQWANKTGATFSGGVRRLVAFCMAAVQPGRVVILDEPTNDVDPLRRRLLWKQVQELSLSGSAVLLVTHNVLEAERAVDRLAIMDQARVVASGRPAQLKGVNHEMMRMEITYNPEPDIPVVPNYLDQTISNGNRLVSLVDEGNVSNAMDWAYQLKMRDIIEEFSIGPTTLEDVYVRLIEGPRVGEMVKKEEEYDPVFA
ncbi:MAG: ABC transporter ATP-binding protein [Dehalococcoidales bacterium]|nr:ABC transporter ATP-binding protein [Dehalococcoidales bacterium]